MDASRLADGLIYRGEMTAVRQTYFVLEAQEYYWVMSFSTKPNAGNFNIVSKKSVDYVFGRFEGKDGVTAKAVVEKAKRTKHAKNSLMALNILYIIVAIGMAKCRAEGPHRQLVFSIKTARPDKKLHLIPKS